jgi:hypothetical protein
MKNRILFILSFSCILIYYSCLCFAEPVYEKPRKASCPKQKPAQEITVDENSYASDRQQAACELSYSKDDEDSEAEGLNWAKAVHEKMLARTQEYHDIVDDMLYTLNYKALQSQKTDEHNRTDELCMVLIDYNSFLGDLKIMKEVLDMADFIKKKNFQEYFDSMARCYEGLKHDFSLKNELFLSRIDILQDEQALSHEKTLLGLYRDYFLYDFRYEQIMPEVKQEKELER